MSKLLESHRYMQGIFPFAPWQLCTLYYTLTYTALHRTERWDWHFFGFIRVWKLRKNFEQRLEYSNDHDRDSSDQRWDFYFFTVYIIFFHYLHRVTLKVCRAGSEAWCSVQYWFDQSFIVKQETLCQYYLGWRPAAKQRQNLLHINITHMSVINHKNCIISRSKQVINCS